MTRFACCLAASVAAVAVLAATGPARAAPSLSTYTATIGGQATLIPPFGCSTGGPPAAAGTFFADAGVGGGAGVPTDGLATCGVSGGFQAKSATTGPLTDTRSLSTSFNAGANSFTGAANANARYGKVGAQANATTTGPSNSFIYYGAEAQAVFREDLTITSASHANGTAGQVVFSFAVDGSLSAVGNGTALFDAVYEQNGGPNFILMRASADPRLGPPFIVSFFGDTSGFVPTVAPGAQSLSGSGEFDTFALNFTYGTPFELAFGLRAWVAPGADGTFETDFLTTALMTGIDVLGVSDFAVTAGSGTRYDADGVHLAQDPGVPGGTVPEPATLVLLAMGLAGLGAARRRRGYVSRCDSGAMMSPSRPR